MGMEAMRPEFEAVSSSNSVSTIFCEADLVELGCPASGRIPIHESYIGAEAIFLLHKARFVSCRPDETQSLHPNFESLLSLSPLITKQKPIQNKLFCR